MRLPFMVAVSGGSGAGKTTFVNSLWQRLEAEKPLVLRLDDYYRDLSHLPLEKRAFRNFDDPEAIERDLLHEQVSLLRRGVAVDRPVYDFASHTRLERSERIEASSVIIIDGIFSLCYPELNKLFDLKIYLDVDADMRVIRRIGRDMAERGRSFTSCSEQYQHSVKAMYERYIAPTKSLADFIVPWHSYNERALAYTAHMILSGIDR